MGVRFLLYLCVLPICVVAINSLNFDRLFKKNQIIQAKLLYFLCSLGLSYLVVNALFDMFMNMNVYS